MVLKQCGVDVDMSIEHFGLRVHALKQIDWFDPMSNVELISSKQLDAGALRSTSNKTQKRPRGRPKQIANSLPVPMSILTTPSQKQQEAVET